MHVTERRLLMDRYVVINIFQKANRNLKIKQKKIPKKNSV